MIREYAYKLYKCNYTAIWKSVRYQVWQYCLLGAWCLYCRASPINSLDLDGVDPRNPALALRQERRGGPRTSSLEYQLEALPQSAPFTTLPPTRHQRPLTSYYFYPSTAPIFTATPNPTPATAATDAANATPLHAAAAALPGRVVAGPPPASQPPCSPARPTSGAGSSGASPSPSCRCRSSRRAGSTAALPTNRGQQWNSSPR